MAVHAPVRRARRWTRAAIAVLVSACTVVAAAAPSSASDSGDLVALTNSSRARSGVAALATHSELMARAQEWSNYMASQGRISHSNVGARVKSNWETIGENVGVGSSVAQVHQMFMNSSGHRANILNPAFQYIGVGTTNRDGRVYVAEIFMRLRGASSAPVVRAPRVRAVAPRASRSVPRVVPAPAPAPPPKPEVPVGITVSLDRLRGTSIV